ncbi:MAG: ABC transporter substrate-binding protein, partial [Eubacteriales bacterium]
QADEEVMGKLAEFGVREYESVYPKFPVVAVSGKGWEEVIWETTMNTNNIAEVLQKLSDDYNEAYDKEIKIGKAQRLVIKDYNPLTPGAGTQEYLTQ